MASLLPSRHRSFLSQEIFDGISDYVITGRQLYGRVMGVATADYQVLGFPLAIENEKVGFILKKVVCRSISRVMD